MIDRARALHARHRGDLRLQVVSRGHPRRRRGDDVGPEGELGIDVGLLVVGGGEDPEVDAEREQQPDDDQATVDRRAPAPRAGQHESARRVNPPPRGASGEPGEHPAPETDEQKGRAEPQQSGREEHVDRQREGGVRIRVDDGREAGARGQPVDEPAHREREQIQIQPLPQRRADPGAGCAAPRSRDPRHTDAVAPMRAASAPAIASATQASTATATRAAGQAKAAGDRSVA